MYVININPENNKVTVGKKKYLSCSRIMIKNIKFCISLEFWPKIITIQIRSNGKIFFANYFLKNKNILLFFKRKTLFTSLGQSAVFYDNDILLGGGIIFLKLDGFRLNIF